MFTAILQIAATVLANLINSRKCSNERADSLNVGVLRQKQANQFNGLSTVVAWHFFGHVGAM